MRSADRHFADHPVDRSREGAIAVEILEQHELEGVGSDRPAIDEFDGDFAGDRQRLRIDRRRGGIDVFDREVGGVSDRIEIDGGVVRRRRIGAVRAVVGGAADDSELSDGRREIGRKAQRHGTREAGAGREADRGETHGAGGKRAPVARRIEDRLGGKVDGQGDVGRILRTGVGDPQALDDGAVRSHRRGAVVERRDQIGGREQRVEIRRLVVRRLGIAAGRTVV